MPTSSIHCLFLFYFLLQNNYQKGRREQCGHLDQFFFFFFPLKINTPLQIWFHCPPAGALRSATDAGFSPIVSLLAVFEMKGHERLLCTAD